MSREVNDNMVRAVSNISVEVSGALRQMAECVADIRMMQHTLADADRCVNNLNHRFTNIEMKPESGSKPSGGLID